MKEFRAACLPNDFYFSPPIGRERCENVLVNGSIKSRKGEESAQKIEGMNPEPGALNFSIPGFVRVQTDTNRPKTIRIKTVSLCSTTFLVNIRSLLLHVRASVKFLQQ